MNVGLISLGCAKNKVDSEEVLSYFVRNGCTLVNDPNLADILVVNTCGFIESAKKEALDTIFDTLKYKKITIVIGCLVERYYDQLVKDIPEVDLFVKIKDYPQFGEKLTKVLKDKHFEGGLDKESRVITSENYQAYLQISDGCDNFCAFCAIPLIRGTFRSFPFDMVKRQIKKFAESGVKELIIISQDTSKYGLDLKGENVTICSVLKEALQYDFKFIRLLYLYPDEITDEFIQLYKDNPRLTPYFDVPIQHASTKILKAMFRHGDKTLLENLYTKLREVKNSIIRTTLIVGFPTETEEDIVELEDFMKKYPFDHLGVFKYSKEEGTKGYYMKQQVPAIEKKKRYNRIMKLQAGISFKLNQQRLNKVYDVLVTSYDEKNYCYNGICEIYAPDDIDGRIYLYSKEPLKIGQMVKAKVINAGIYDLDLEVI